MAKVRDKKAFFVFCGTVSHKSLKELFFFFQRERVWPKYVVKKLFLFFVVPVLASD
jgi:hypothetical protein